MSGLKFSTPIYRNLNAAYPAFSALIVQKKIKLRNVVMKRMSESKARFQEDREGDRTRRRIDVCIGNQHSLAGSP